ncbi:serine/threonine-protein kinase [Rhodococcus antarcticus]|uniref:serine/threonine-protein kinase n=1 Tax=Rhodococcus antarcticus TaxID=2987751 RepID=UPI0025B6E21F|nr:serine/threonine-protein kinase [Rhodococcus antarcticus]
MHLSPGAVLADRYRLTSRIATGGMGEVWEALDTRLHRRVAVKVLKPEISSDPEFLERFRVEARTAAGLNHPGVAGVYDYGETSTLEDADQETAYLVMELVEGEPLSAVLAREGRIDVGHSLDMLEQTGRALQAAHAQGVVHRDVKPGNILITPDGRVKITDFGIAKAVDAAPVTRTGMVMGTAQYIAPEQALGQEAGPASDVYSLAVVGYEAVSGLRPFTSDNALTVAMMHIRDVPPPLPADLPAPVRELLLAAMVKDPTQRYRNGGELADAVAAVRAGRPLPLPGGWTGGGPATADPTAVLGRATAPLRAPAAPLRAVPTPVPAPLPGREHDRSSRTAGWLWFGGILVVGLLGLALYLLLTFTGGPGSTGTTPPVIVTTTAPTTPAPTTPPSPTTTAAPTTPPSPTTTAAPTTPAPTTTTPTTTTLTTTAPPTTTPTSAPAPTTTPAGVTLPSTTPPVTPAAFTGTPRSP